MADLKGNSTNSPGGNELMSFAVPGENAIISHANKLVLDQKQYPAKLTEVQSVKK